MLSIMAKSKKKGYLLDNEKQMESKTLAKLTGSTIEEIESLLGELEAHGVYSKTSEGIIFNRRMVRVVEISKIRSEAGKLGGRPKKQIESKRQSKTKARSASVYASSSLNKDLKYLRRTKNKKETKGVVNGGTQKITLILDEEPKRWEGITPELKALWAKSYPGCDIDTVLQEMIAYWDAQPKAKRKINWKVTIVNRLKWLQDHGGTRGGVTGGVMEWLAKEKEKEKLNE